MKNLFSIPLIIVCFGILGCEGEDASQEEIILSQWSLVYTSYENNASHIYKMPLDSFQTINLSDTIFSAQSPGDYFFPDGDFQAEVSPNGSKIVFASNKRPNGNLFVLDLSSNEIIPQAINALKPTNPVWSPAGRLIAFEGSSQYFSSLKTLYLIDIEGTAFENPMQITFPENGQSDNGGLTFLEDGKKIIFARQPHGSSLKDLYLKSIFKPDSLAVALTNTPNASEYLPVISSDFSLLAFHSFDPSAGIRKIIIATPENPVETLHEIDLNAIQAINPGRMDFAPDNSGLFLSFDKENEGGSGMAGYELYFVSLDGNTLIRLTENNYPDTDPSFFNIEN